jgi:hypothetical protein
MIGPCTGALALVGLPLSFRTVNFTLRADRPERFMYFGGPEYKF